MKDNKPKVVYTPLLHGLVIKFPFQVCFGYIDSVKPVTPPGAVSTGRAERTSHVPFMHIPHIGQCYYSLLHEIP